MNIPIKLVFVGFIVSLDLIAQIESPIDIQIGKPLPELMLTNIQYYQKESLSTNEMKGTPFVLFLWDRHCVSAFKYLSRMDKLAEEFEGQLEVIVIAGKASLLKEDNLKEIDALKNLFECAKRLQNLQLPITYDLKLFKKIVTQGVPHFVLVDGKGIVKVVTADLDKGKIEAFLKGEDFSFNDYSASGLKKEYLRIDAYDKYELFMVNHNGGQNNKFEFRSLITPYTDEMPMGKMVPSNIAEYDYWKKLEGIGALKDFYKLAYFGEYGDFTKEIDWEYYPTPILEIRDSLPFIDFRYNKPLKNMYWYSLVVPEKRRDKESLMRIMQHDLKDFFGYMAKIEKRKLPYWRISLPEMAKDQLRSKGGTELVDSNYYTKIGVINLPVGHFLQKILYMVSASGFDRIPFLDRTGGGLNVDIPMQKVDFSDFSSIKNVLEKLGFQVEKTYGIFNALVIYDVDNDNRNAGQ